MGWGKNQYELVRILVRKPCKGYYVRWYYNGWHYWFFLPGSEIFNTEGEEYRTLGTKKVTMSSGQITLGQCAAVRTILNTREIYLYGDAGWANVRVSPGSATVYDNQIDGYEIELTMIIGSKTLSRTGFTPIVSVPDVPIVPIVVCEVTIGTQIWMCNNYDSKYPGSKVYEDNEFYRSIYGGLYTHNQVVAAGFCPAGWHVPTLAEWQTLIAYVESIAGAGSAGGELKDATSTYWITPNTGAADTYGFKALPTGFNNGSFTGLGFFTKLWTSTVVGAGTAEAVQIAYNTAAAYIYATDQFHFCPVRLIKDNAATSLVDLDGNVYTVVVIGTQQWIVENLKVTKYANGAAISNLTLNADWIADLAGAYCWYDNNIANKTPYGALYNWYAVNNGLAYLERGGVQEAGWRIPAKTDFDSLTAFLNGEAVAGGKLKETGLTHWNAPNLGATNESGFTAIGGGARSNLFNGILDDGLFWSSTEDILQPLADAYCQYVTFDGSSSSYYDYPKYVGLSVRLVRDI